MPRDDRAAPALGISGRHPGASAVAASLGVHGLAVAALVALPHGTPPRPIAVVSVEVVSAEALGGSPAGEAPTARPSTPGPESDGPGAARDARDAKISEVEPVDAPPVAETQAIDTPAGPRPDAPPIPEPPRRKPTPPAEPAPTDPRLADDTPAAPSPPASEAGDRAEHPVPARVERAEAANADNVVAAALAPDAFVTDGGGEDAAPAPGESNGHARLVSGGGSDAGPRYAGPGLANRAPRYPRVSRIRGEEGRVVLRVQVTAAGAAASVHVRRSSGHRRLDEAAIEAVRTWRFEPATRFGMRVAGAVDVPIVFRLEG